ncbi:uncharacterized protein MELLADRAFT_59976 [Melampsora larici-populina 98AG31]|uniref:Uncharacterized protein n=1 Tax=Melampsora larici-populina (strain 98AG31 / pathotype 3-4-7) TaxID=747676 RepID=F4R9H9_MELLP|nr:uncharacterized protein MELLADRAFT_59976 [Melampsora larici-populina 98AG31]EGG11149.1 hypothetical protein MELLADRAFT_59976 [Melampsora larici-populina 98AG31]
MTEVQTNTTTIEETTCPTSAYKNVDSKDPEDPSSAGKMVERQSVEAKLIFEVSDDEERDSISSSVEDGEMERGKKDSEKKKKASTKKKGKQNTEVDDLLNDDQVLKKNKTRYEGLIEHDHTLEGSRIKAPVIHA